MDNCSQLLASVPDNLTETQIWSRLHQEERRETISKIPAFMYMALLIVFGVSGNIIVLLVYWIRFRMSTTKCFIIAMAAFDLCSCLIGMPFEIVDIRFDFELDTPVGCRIMRFLISLFAYGSVLVLIGVAVDRFQRVCRPYSRQMTVKNSKRGIAIMTVIATVFSLPNLIFYGRQTIAFKGLTLVDCSIDDRFSQSVFPKLYFVVQGFCWFLAIVLLSIMYGFIIFNIKKANKRRDRLDSSSLSNNNINHVGTSSFFISKHYIGQHGNKSNDDVSRRANAGRSPFPAAVKSDDGHEESKNEAEGSQSSPVGKGDNPGGRRFSWKTNKLARLFSRDVNPVSDNQDGDVKSTTPKDSPGVLFTLSDQDEEAARAGLEDVQERSGLEDGVSLQNLIANEHCQNVTEGDGVPNLSAEGESKKSRGKLHVSASEGNGLDDPHGLNKHHKVLSESLQELDAINSSADLAGFQNSLSSQKPKSMGQLRSSSSEYDQNQVAYESSLHQIDEENIVPFQHTTANSPEGEEDLQNHLGAEKQTSQHECPLPVNNDNVSSGCKKVEFGDNTTLSGASGVADRESTIVDPLHATEDANTTSPRMDNREPTENQRDSTLSDSSSNCPRRPPPSNSNNNSNNSARHSRTSIQRQTSICSNNEYGYGGHNSYNVTSSSYAVLSKRKQSTVKELKTSKLAMMMFHVTLGFVLSYLPHLSLQIAKILNPDGMARLMCDTTFFGFYHVALRSIFLNHTVNPLIYGYFNKRFREYCKVLLTSPIRFLTRSSTASTDKTQQSFSMDQA